MAQAIRRSHRRITTIHALRNLRMALRRFAAELIDEARPRSRCDWSCMAGMVAWLVIVGLVFANWWGGA